MKIAENILRIKQSLPPNVQLIVVSKTQSVENIMAAYTIGQRDFGESRAQELQYKAEHLPKDIHWHFIGHLQSNKAKSVVKLAHTIHSIDSIRLLHKVEACCQELNIVRQCLLQVHLAQESTKFGFDAQTLQAYFTSSTVFQKLHNTQIIGIMGMASNTDKEKQITQEFDAIKNIFSKIKPLASSLFTEVSMGMSNDYKLAIESGSTMVRIGSTIFQ
ncbi:MAG: YggS family pyridoxal phosphate-dependent enzyme [Bacteroidales bacterium]